MVKTRFWSSGLFEGIVGHDRSYIRDPLPVLMNANYELRSLRMNSVLPTFAISNVNTVFTFKSTMKKSIVMKCT